MVGFGILILSGSRGKASWDKKSVGESRMESESGLVGTSSVDCHNTCFIVASGSSLFSGCPLHSIRVMEISGTGIVWAVVFLCIPQAGSAWKAVRGQLTCPACCSNVFWTYQSVIDFIQGQEILHIGALSVLLIKFGTQIRVVILSATIQQWHHPIAICKLYRLAPILKKCSRK